MLAKGEGCLENVPRKRGTKNREIYEFQSVCFVLANYHRFSQQEVAECVVVGEGYHENEKEKVCHQKE